ncbi:MAG: hypothetical protein M4579_003222 [Chaenotheca gracillima]|nr:MAG: hypothetical protein M4579_003222 [Chaenotheca gracillima]
MEPPQKRMRLSSAEDDTEPDLELQQARLDNDFRLKSVFEGIFEKYGKDFTGVGDEIDIETGEVIVDNGHLRGMEDEQDVGEDTDPPTIELSEDSDGAEDELEFDDHGRKACTGDESTSKPSYNEVGIHNSRASEWKDDSRFSGNLLTSSPSRQTIPSDASILEQFGDEVGPQVIRYVAQLQPVNESTVEPAWQTPDTAPRLARKRPILKALLGQRVHIPPHVRGSTSIWSLPKPSPRRKEKVFDPYDTDFCSDSSDVLDGHSPSIKTHRDRKGNEEREGQLSPEYRWNSLPRNASRLCGDCGIGGSSPWRRRRDRADQWLCNRCYKRRYRKDIGSHNVSPKSIDGNDADFRTTSKSLQKKHDQISRKAIKDDSPSLLRIFMEDDVEAETPLQSSPPPTPSRPERGAFFVRSTRIASEKVPAIPSPPPSLVDYRKKRRPTPVKVFEPGGRGCVSEKSPIPLSPSSSKGHSSTVASPLTIDLTSSPEPSSPAMTPTSKRARKEASTPIRQIQSAPTKSSKALSSADSSEDELMTPTKFAIGRSPGSAVKSSIGARRQLAFAKHSSPLKAFATSKEPR